MIPKTSAGVKLILEGESREERISVYFLGCVAICGRKKKRKW
jgi:hypothetical protein